MDEKIQLGPRAQVTWVKGSSGGAKASDSGKNTLINWPTVTAVVPNIAQVEVGNIAQTFFEDEPSVFHLAKR